MQKWMKQPVFLDSILTHTGVVLSCMLGFLGSLPMWSKCPNEKTHLSHLFKWRMVILDRHRERV